MTQDRKDRDAAFTWNIEVRGLREDERLREHVRRELGRLERRLQRFRPDLVHLFIYLNRPSRGRSYEARLTLRVPSNILHAEAEGPEASTALREAGSELERQLEKLKTQLRRESEWRRGRRSGAAREPAPRTAEAFATTPLEEPGLPESAKDVIRRALEEEIPALRRYAARRLEGEAAAAPDLPVRSLSASDIVGETAERILAAEISDMPAGKFLGWIYRICDETIAESLRRLEEEGAAFLQSAEEGRPEPSQAAAETDDAYDPEQPLYIIAKLLEESPARPEDALPDPSEVSIPAKAAEASDMAAYLRELASGWPAEDRKRFERFFYEGLEPFEIALVEGRAESEVRADLERLLERAGKQARADVEKGLLAWPTEERSGS